MIKQCPHQTLADLPLLERVSRLLDGAERVVSSAESLLHEVRLRHRTDEALAEAADLEARAGQPVELIETAEINLARIEELLNQAVNAEQEAMAARRDADELLLSSGIDVDPSDAVAQTNAAEEIVREAEDVLDRVPRRSDRVALLRNRADAVRGRIAVLRSQTGSSTTA